MGRAHKIEGKNAVDVANEFHWFFLIGFTLMMLQIVYTLLGVCYVHTNKAWVGKLAKILIAITSVTSVLWLILGSIFRFKQSGVACSEDLLHASGKFIFVYLIIMFVILGLFLCCGVVACIIIKPSRNNRAAS